MKVYPVLVSRIPQNAPIQGEVNSAIFYNLKGIQSNDDNDQVDTERSLNIEAVIESLRDAKSGSRGLDIEIAQLFGWKRAFTRVRDEAGHDTRRTLWLVPKTEDPGRVPNYTTSLDAAFDLAQEIAPRHVGGCSWEDGMGTARIGAKGPYVEAASPALAICIAALIIHKTLS